MVRKPGSSPRTGLELGGGDFSMHGEGKIARETNPSVWLQPAAALDGAAEGRVLSARHPDAEPDDGETDEVFKEGVGGEDDDEVFEDDEFNDDVEEDDLDDDIDDDVDDIEDYEDEEDLFDDEDLESDPDRHDDEYEEYYEEEDE